MAELLRMEDGEGACRAQAALHLCRKEIIWPHWKAPGVGRAPVWGCFWPWCCRTGGQWLGPVLWWGKYGWENHHGGTEVCGSVQLDSCCHSFFCVLWRISDVGCISVTKFVLMLVLKHGEISLVALFEQGRSALILVPLASAGYHVSVLSSSEAPEGLTGIQVKVATLGTINPLVKPAGFLRLCQNPALQSGDVFPCRRVKIKREQQTWPSAFKVAFWLQASSCLLCTDLNSVTNG